MMSIHIVLRSNFNLSPKKKREVTLTCRVDLSTTTTTKPFVLSKLGKARYETQVTQQKRMEIKK
jgi:hypothetical protein